MPNVSAGMRGSALNLARLSKSASLCRLWVMPLVWIKAGTLRAVTPPANEICGKVVV